MRAFQYSAVLGFLFSAIAVARSTAEPRSITSLGQLYAYGTNITGLAIFYADEKAYVGDCSLADSTAVDVIFTLSGTTLIAEAVTSGSTASIGTSDLSIDPTTNGLNDVLLSNSTSASYISTGFISYGAQIAWKDSKRNLNSNFVAVPTDVDGLWQLKWNAGSTLTDDCDGVLVNVKSIAPTTL